MPKLTASTLQLVESGFSLLQIFPREKVDPFTLRRGVGEPESPHHKEIVSWAADPEVRLAERGMSDADFAAHIDGLIAFKTALHQAFSLGGSKMAAECLELAEAGEDYLQVLSPASA